MTLLTILIAFTILLAIVGTIGLAGLQDWGMIFMLPIVIVFIAMLIGATTLFVMTLTEWLADTPIRDRYGIADFWSAVLIVAYAVGGTALTLGFRSQRAKKNATQPSS
jgi:uncharacterized membrane protein